MKKVLYRDRVADKDWKYWKKVGVECFDNLIRTTRWMRRNWIKMVLWMKKETGRA